MKIKNTKQIIIALEGIDGAGKSTLINLVCHRLNNQVEVYKRTKKGSIINYFVSIDFFKKHYMFLMPVYLLLSYKNYIVFKLTNQKKPIVIMDRCFLSNICYFFPDAIINNKKLHVLLLFEVKLFPHAVFVLDVDPSVGLSRDGNKKTLEWLTSTRQAYLNIEKSQISDFVDVTTLPADLSLNEKADIIVNYINLRQEAKNTNGM